MKKVLVFGGTGGLGSALVSQYNNQDFEFISLGSNNCDVTNEKEVCDLLNNIDFDYVINLSGISKDSMIHKLNEIDVNKQINVNIIGNLNIIKHSVNKMRTKGGKIILISSILSLRPVKGTSVYSASKAFIDNLVKSVSIENSKYNITCNSIQLGYFDGGLTYTIPEDIRDKFKSEIPMGRWGTIDELYNTIKYILTTDYLTGESIKIAGGL